MNDEVEDHNDANSVANEPILDTVQVSDVFEESVQTTKPLSLLQQIALAGVEFSFQAHIAALMVVLIPARVVQFVGPDKKGSFLAVIVFGGAGLACVLGPVFGYLSDNTRFKYGKRRIWILLSVLLDCIGILLMALSPNYILFVMAFLFTAAAVTAAAAPFAGFLHDVVSKEDVGSTTGICSFLGFIGYLTGGLTGLIDTSSNYGFYALIAVMLIGMTSTVASVTEKSTIIPTAEHVEDAKVPISRPKYVLGLVTSFIRASLRPFVQNLDFRWVCITHFFISIASVLSTSFPLYYITDVFEKSILFNFYTFETASSAVSACVTASIIGSIISSLLVGKFADKASNRRAIMLSVCNLCNILVCLVSIIGCFTAAIEQRASGSSTITFSFFFMFYFIRGLADGGITALTWGVAVHSSKLNKTQDTGGQSMGMWQTSSVFARVMGTLVGGLLLDLGRAWWSASSSYFSVYFLAATCYAIAMITIFKVKVATTNRDEVLG